MPPKREDNIINSNQDKNVAAPFTAQEIENMRQKMGEEQFKEHWFQKENYTEIVFELKVARKYVETADNLFFQEIVNKRATRKWNERERKFFRYLYRAALETKPGCCIRVSLTNAHSENWNRDSRNIILAAVNARLFYLVKAKPHDKDIKDKLEKGEIDVHKSSRLIPLEAIYKFENEGNKEMKNILKPKSAPIRNRDYNNLVRIKKKINKHTKIDVPLPTDPVTKTLIDIDTDILRRANEAFKTFSATYVEEATNILKTIDPFIYCSHSDSYGRGGRVYSDSGGVILLSEDERKTIRFNWKENEDEECCILDFESLHARMLYHLAGQPFETDCYKLWGKETTPEKRHIAKVVTNAMINAKNKESVIYSLKEKTVLTTKSGKRKTGRDYERVKKLREALTREGINLKYEGQLKKYLRYIRDTVLNFHAPISHMFFNKENAYKLQFLDSRICLLLIDKFEKEKIPIFSVHDGFIVPRSKELILKDAMDEFYSQKIGFYPSITKG